MVLFSFYCICFPLPPSLCLSLLLPLPAAIILFSLFPLPLLLGAISDLFWEGGGRAPWVSFSQKKKKKERRKEGKKDTFPHNLHQELNRFWQIILASHYLRNVAANFSPNSHPLFFSPRPQNKRVRNHRINWAKGANLPKCLWSNKWEERRMSVLIYPLFQVPSSLWRPQGWME